jgi:hypothetical protein
MVHVSRDTSLEELKKLAQDIRPTRGVRDVIGEAQEREATVLGTKR